MKIINQDEQLNMIILTNPVGITEKTDQSLLCEGAPQGHLKQWH